jgi:SAM-dependent methyltransferase
MSANQGQLHAWNGGESVHYVTHADRYDRQLALFTTALLARAAPTPQDTVLDVGCGCGVTTLMVADRAQRVLGLDISHPLVEIANRRALEAGLLNADFLVADAQTHDFADGEFTLIVSQFGSMFFDDPEAAFANLRRSLAPGGRMSLVCWQGLEANEWLTVVAQEVERYCELPEFGGSAGGPGIFTLKDPDETVALLKAAGFGRVEVEPVATTVLVAGGGTVDESLEFLLGMGMVRGLLGRLSDDEREHAAREVRSALAERYEPEVGVTIGAAGWLVSARN